MSDTAGERPIDEAGFDAMPGSQSEVDYTDKTIPRLVQERQEAVNHPAHYGGDTVYEVIKVLEAWELTGNAYLFNVVKYIARAGKKGDVLEDLKKARFYLDREITNLEKR